MSSLNYLALGLGLGLVATASGFTPLPSSGFAPRLAGARDFASRLHAVGGIIPATPEDIAATKPMTYDEIAEAAAFWGCRIESTTLGPAYRRAPP